MQKTNIKTFEDVLKCLNYINSINDGGCGISALAMHRWMCNHKETLFSFDFVCVYLKDSNDRYITNKAYVENGMGNLIAPDHVLYKLNNKFYDSKGKQHIRDYDYDICIGTEENLLKMINNVKEWNGSFNRKKQLHYIEKKLDISLRDVQISNFENNYTKIFALWSEKYRKVLSLLNLIIVNNKWMKTIQSVKMN
jgi:hypothetical protein